MPARPKIPTGAFAWRLAFFYSALCAALGFQMPFLPVWLAAKGLDAGAVGIALAIPLVIRVVAIPIATRIADRCDAARAVIIIGAAGSLLGYVAVALAWTPEAIMAAIALASAFYAPLMPLADAYALGGLAARGRSYGPVRLWGSGAFIAGTLGGGLLLDLIAPLDLIWVVVTALLVNAGAAGLLAPLGVNAPTGLANRASASVLLCDRRFLVIAGAAALIQASHAVYYGFSTLQWRAAGLDGVTIGILWAVGVVAEIALFAISARLALKPVALLLAGAAGGVLRWGMMAFDPPVLTLAVLHACMPSRLAQPIWERLALWHGLRRLRLPLPPRAISRLCSRRSWRPPWEFRASFMRDGEAAPIGRWPSWRPSARLRCWRGRLAAAARTAVPMARGAHPRRDDTWP